MFNILGNPVITAVTQASQLAVRGVQAIDSVKVPAAEVAMPVGFMAVKLASNALLVPSNAKSLARSIVRREKFEFQAASGLEAFATLPFFAIGTVEALEACERGLATRALGVLSPFAEAESETSALAQNLAILRQVSEGKSELPS